MMVYPVNIKSKKKRRHMYREKCCQSKAIFFYSRDLDSRHRSFEAMRDEQFHGNISWVIYEVAVLSLGSYDIKQLCNCYSNQVMRQNVYICVSQVCKNSIYANFTLHTKILQTHIFSISTQVILKLNLKTVIYWKLYLARMLVPKF